MKDNEQFAVSPPEAVRRKSVKELSALFAGKSTVETQSDFERKMRVYNKIWSLTRYASDKKAILKLNSPMKRKLMEDWSSAVLEEDQLSDISPADARSFLADHGVLRHTVGEDQWKEWEEAIIVATSPVRIDRKCGEQNTNAIHDLQMKPHTLEFDAANNSIETFQTSNPQETGGLNKTKATNQSWFTFCKWCPCKI